MGRRRDLQSEDGGDDYTPATDLVFSMFAMVVLLLAVVGAGGQVARFTVPGAPPREPPAPADMLGDADAVTAPRRPLPDTPGRTDQLRLGSVTEAEVGPFMVDGTRFSPRALERVEAVIASSADAIAAAQATRLVIDVSTSASRGAASDGTDMDMMETMIWAEALMRALRATPLPVGCVSVMPSGKLKSAYLRRLSTGPGAGKALDDFERMLGLKQLPQPIAQVIARGRADDRHLTLWAQRGNYDDCDAETLATAVRALRPKAAP